MHGIKAAKTPRRSARASCQGRYGYFVVGTGVVNTGGSSQSAKALLPGGRWQVGHGLTLNLGVRFDTEKQLAGMIRPVFPV